MFTRSLISFASLQSSDALDIALCAVFPKPPLASEYKISNEFIHCLICAKFGKET